MVKRRRRPFSEGAFLRWVSVRGWILCVSSSTERGWIPGRAASRGPESRRTSVGSALSTGTAGMWGGEDTISVLSWETCPLQCLATQVQSRFQEAYPIPSSVFLPTPPLTPFAQFDESKQLFLAHLPSCSLRSLVSWKQVLCSFPLRCLLCVNSPPSPCFQGETCSKQNCLNTIEQLLKKRALCTHLSQGGMKQTTRQMDSSASTGPHSLLPLAGCPYNSERTSKAAFKKCRKFYDSP